MTRRAFLFGLAGALFIAGFGYINNAIVRLNPVELGYLLPVGVVGSLLVWMAAINPLLFRFRRPWALRPAELAVIALMLATAMSIAGGLAGHFPNMLATPAYWNRITPGWSESRILSYAPEAMLVASRQEDSEVLFALISGMGSSTSWIGLKDIPWAAWARPLAVWLPLVVLTTVATLCLSLIVHSQWARRERLRYPIAEFVTMLLIREPDRATGPLYRSRGFWAGALVVVAIYVVNGLNVWFDTGIVVQLTFNFRPLGNKWPEFFSYPQAGYLLRPTLYPMVIGFAYFLASDISLTMGLSQYLMALAYVPLLAYGVPMQTDYMAGGAWGWERAGAYVAYTSILLYTGRRYYRDVLCQAVTLRPRADVEPYQAWACRGLIVSLAAMVAMTTALGLSWTLSVLTVLLLMVIFLCVSRIAAETGLFNIHARWAPVGLLLGLLGGHAFGPRGIVMVGLLSAALCFAPGMALMPFFTNALKTCDSVGVPPKTAAWASLGAYLPGLALAMVVVLWANYNFGIPQEVGPGYQWIPSMIFNTALQEVAPLKLAGTLQESMNLGAVERLLRMHPDPLCLWSAGIGCFLVLALSFLRLRFTWWALHPVLLLLVATAPMSRFNHSFLIGWAVKTAISHWGGHGVYQRCKPLMAGLIAGDLLGTLLSMAAGAIYYAFTGQQPPQYHAIGV